MAYIGVFFPNLWAKLSMKYSPHIYKTTYARIRLPETFPPKLFLKWLGKPCWYAKQKTLFYATGPDFVDFSHMRPLCFKTAGISKLLCGLGNNKAPGPDGIHPRIIRQLSLAIAPTLQVIFEKTYREGVVPDDWRRANVCPIYKKKSKKGSSQLQANIPYMYC